MTRVDAEHLLHFETNEVPSGTINGSNTSFTLAFTPQYSGAVQLFLDGLFLTNGTDYTVSGTTITMTTAPAVAQVLTASYWRKTGEN